MSQYNRRRKIRKSPLIGTSVLRSHVFYGLWGLWTGLFGLLIPLLWIAGPPPRTVRGLTRIWARGILGLLSGVVGLRYEVRGGENSALTPGLIIANHELTWETLAALVLFPDVAIVTKQELLSIPIMGWYLRRSPMIMIDRDDGRKALRAMVEQGQEALAGGRSVLIFPEGARKQTGEPVEFKRGVALLYKTFAVPVLPVVVTSGRFLGNWKCPQSAGNDRRVVLAADRPRTERGELRQHSRGPYGEREKQACPRGDRRNRGDLFLPDLKRGNHLLQAKQWGALLQPSGSRAGSDRS